MSSPVAVVAYLPPPQLTVLREALPRSTSVHTAATLPELDTLLTLYPGAVAVVDPRGSNGRDQTLYRVFDTHPAVPVVMYMALSPLAVHASVSFVDRGVRRLILRGFDDSPERIREVVAAAPADTFVDEFLAAIKSVMESLPPMVWRAIRNLFYDPLSIVKIDDLAHTAGMGRRTLQEYLERANLAPAGIFLRASRVLHVYHHLRQRQLSIKAISVKMGYTNGRLLAREVQRIIGCLPSVLLQRMTHAETMAQIANRLRGQPADRAECSDLAFDDLSQEPQPLS